MRIVAIGHESWLISQGDESFLIDPILHESFGSDRGRQFTVCPNRAIDFESIPKLSAIVFTSEHLQHFHPKSLKTLKDNYPHKLLSDRVFVPELFPAAAANIIAELGFKVERIDIQSNFDVAGICCKYYMPFKDVLFWDNRVASLYVCDNQGQAAFFQSDTKISDDFYSDVAQGLIKSPDVLVVTNNFNKSAEGKAFGLDNILPIDDGKYSGLTGLRLLNELTNKPVRKLRKVPTVIIAGNGYLPPGSNIVPVWSNLQLAEIATQLSIVTIVESLSPGDIFEVKERKKSIGSAKWIQLIRDGHLEEEATQQRTNSDSSQIDIGKIKSHLDEMAKTWLITNYGQVLLGQHQYLGRNVGSHRLAILLALPSQGYVQFVFDISRVEFVLVDDEGSSAIKKYPFGVVVDCLDFMQLIDGRIQIWELINISASQWYVCDRYESPLAFWLEYYNEQTDHERTYKSYLSSLDWG